MYRELTVNQLTGIQLLQALVLFTTSLLVSLQQLSAKGESVSKGLTAQLLIRYCPPKEFDYTQKIQLCTCSHDEQNGWRRYRCSKKGKQQQLIFSVLAVNCF